MGGGNGVWGPHKEGIRSASRAVGFCLTALLLLKLIAEGPGQQLLTLVLLTT